MDDKMFIPNIPTLLPWLFWGALTSCLLFLATNHRCRDALKKRWRLIGLIVLIALWWRVPFDGHFFYGLEYEDSYVYPVAGRYLTVGSNACGPVNSCYLTTVCAVGNLNSCKVTETFSGHFVGYAFMVAVASRIFGYSPTVASYLSLAASLIAVVLIFMICSLINPGRVAAAAASLVFCLTPAFAVYGIGTYAEPVSNTLVLVCVLLCICLLNPAGDESPLGLILNWSALTLTAVFAVVVKRENVLLIPVLLLTGFVLHFFNRSGAKQQKWSRYLLVLATVWICVEFTLGPMQMMRTVQNETAEYGLFPFNPAVFRIMLPLFAKSYLSLSWYLGGWIFVLLGVIFSIRLRTPGIFAISVFAAYLFVYASHVRSYYQLQGGAATEFDTLRYSMNLAGLWSIIAGLGFSHLFEIISESPVQRLLHTVSRKVLWLAMGAYALSSWVLTSEFREDMFADEFTARIRPAQSAIDTAVRLGVQNTFVITQEPLLIQMLSRQPVNVIHSGYLDVVLVKDLLRGNPNLTLVYLKQQIYNPEPERERYKASFTFLGRLHKAVLFRGEDYTIYQVDLSLSESSDDRD